MDIKIGFTQAPRELVISSSAEPKGISQKVAQALGGQDATLTLEDDKGRSYVLRTDAIAYVEVGLPERRSVGFAGA